MAAGSGVSLALWAAFVALLALWAGVQYVRQGPVFENRPHVAVLECPGGTDKGSDGHRADTKHLLKGLRAEGMDAEAYFYTDEGFEELLVRIASRSDAFVSRVDPGVYPTCTMKKYYDFLQRLDDLGVMAFNHPDDMVAMGSKKSLINLLGLPLSVNDTLIYSSWRQFKRYFPRTLERAIEAGGRVLKQNSGSKGEGVWWVQVYEEDETLAGAEAGAAAGRTPLPATDGPSRGTNRTLPIPTAKKSARSVSFDFSWPFGNRRVTDKTIIRAVEASDNREVVTTLGNFTQETCAQYLEDAGEIIDMEYLPRIREGEIRLVIAGRRVVYVVEKRPAAIATSGDGFSANLDAGARHIWSGPETWPEVVLPFYTHLDTMLQRMGAKNPPALWTADFIRAGTEDHTTFVLSEVNANCVGFKAHPKMGRDLAAWVRHELERKRMAPQA